MRRYCVLLMFLLAACTSVPVEPGQQPASSSSSVPQAIEQLPAELSVAYFGEMKLVGTDFAMTKEFENGAYTRYGISYRSNGLKITGILNIPKGAGPFPLLVFNHGYIDPKIYTNGRGLKREQDFLARRGFSVLHTDYRGHAGSDPSPDTRKVYDAGLEYSMDSVNAVNAIRAANIPQIDATKIGMLGHSMGGGVALNIAVTRPDFVSAFVLYAPVNTDAWQNFNRWRRERDEDDRTVAVMGSMRDEHPQLWDALSSKPLLKDINAPILLFHGTNDEDVPLEWSQGLTEGLNRLGKEIEFVTYEGEGHEFSLEWSDFMERTAKFFGRHIGPVTSPANMLDIERIRAKPFGIHITLADSPVSPERFEGYHTGADFEVLPGENESEIPVPALCDGAVVLSKRVSGYGGVVVQKCQFDEEEDFTVLYGHLAPASLPGVGTKLTFSQNVGKLGKRFSVETDGERAHLHLAVHRGSGVELRGYVKNEADLAAWIDPVEIINR